LQQRSWREVFERLWLRCAKLYGYHLGLLAVAFTVVAAIAVHTRSRRCWDCWISIWRITL
jgi:hypothetical protein